MARDDALARPGQAFQRVVALEHVALVVEHAEHAPRIDVRVEVRGIGGEHDGAALGRDAHALQPFRMAADLVHRDAGRELVRAVVELHAA